MYENSILWVFVTLKFKFKLLMRNKNHDIFVKPDSRKGDTFARSKK